MNNHTDLPEHSVPALRNALKTLPQLMSFSQPMSARRPARDFMVPVAVSAVIHILLACLFWVMFIDLTTVKPVPPENSTPLILTLSTFTEADPHDEMDIEVTSTMPHTLPSADNKPEEEAVEISKGQGAPESEVPVDESPEAETALSFDLESATRMKWDFGIKEGFEAETPDGKYHTIDQIPLIDMDAVYRSARKGSWMSESEIQNLRIDWRIRYMEKHRALLPPDCRTAYAGMGILSIPFLIRDAITESGCEWRNEEKREATGKEGNKPSIWPTID